MLEYIGKPVILIPSNEPPEEANDEGVFWRYHAPNLYGITHSSEKLLAMMTLLMTSLF